jgi:hypothetical protein
VPREKVPPPRGTTPRVTVCGNGYVEELLLEFDELFEDEFELEFEELLDELFEDEFELEFEELLDELFEDEFELEFEELLDELFEDEFELEFEELLDELFEEELLLVLDEPRLRNAGRLRASVQPSTTCGFAPAISATASAGRTTGAVDIN